MSLLLLFAGAPTGASAPAQHAASLGYRQQQLEQLRQRLLQDDEEALLLILTQV